MFHVKPNPPAPANVRVQWNKASVSATKEHKPAKTLAMATSLVAVAQRTKLLLTAEELEVALVPEVVPALEVELLVAPTAKL